MNKILAISIIIGLIFLIFSVVYFIEPAKSLPSFFPGYDRTLTKHHYTHAVGALVLALAVFVFAWFNSGKKLSKEKVNATQ